MNNCIYRLIGENREILYIGKASNLKQRLRNHTHLPEGCYEKTKKIEYHSFNTKGDMDIAEIYYISKHKPVYNDVLKHDISITIKEFEGLEFKTYTRKNSSNKTKGIMRNLELYIKNNSFESYTLNDCKKRYRVHHSFIENEIEKFEKEGIYTEFNGYEKTTKFGKEYEVCSYLVYSYEDDYSFYIYYEKKIEYDDFFEKLDKISESCDHDEIIHIEKQGICYITCNKCGTILDSTIL